MKIRVKFSKHGAIRYIGHLDMMRYFQKAIRRSAIPVAYTNGFNPHQRLAFAQPLGVGIESDGEYFDLEVTSQFDKNQMIDSLNQTMADGIKILDMVLLPENSKNAMASVQAASYHIRFFQNHEPNFTWKTELFDFLNTDRIIYTKQTKKNTVELNLKESIYDFQIKDDGFYLLLNASSGGNIKPKYIFEAFFKALSFPLDPFALFVTRMETYGKIDEHGVSTFVPLSFFGENF